ncbi:ATP-dependent DNA helicase Q-like SIM isoform X2 [Oryza brachyantha]|uniref:ATP-dependent DNA helicase n=1 Tax=Oryza brachyantha TaxID=4533 RepID=J3M414_ORYBR|nr:ATP-dependent DNA helicase Q-like SIM isoform X2 [Oryza brachyantha]
MDDGATEGDVSADRVIAELLDMGFEFDKISQAIGVVGPRRADVLEFVLSDSGNGRRKPSRESQGRHSVSSNAEACSSGRHSVSSNMEARSSDDGNKLANRRRRLKQLSITDHLASNTGCEKGSCGEKAITSYPYLVASNDPGVPISDDMCSALKPESQVLLANSRTESDRRDKISLVLQKHFGFSCVKGFQQEALDAWCAHKDCLVLAATGSGKSLCFQIPALLTAKVVVVISPLISLMHDQCLKLAKHGISACFLGSGQPDSRVEGKAMSGKYKIIYVCPETALRLMEPLKKLAENPGIALFAIDEVHCVSKWGHDFRPDYRKLSVLRENFSSSKLKFLEHDIPLMALTATATIPVRADIIKSLKMSEHTVIVLTSFFRPNLRFTVKHSRTSASAYGKDFRELIDTYSNSRNFMGKKQKALHEINPDSESSSYESPDDTMSDDEDTYVDSTSHVDNNFDKTKVGMPLRNENAENELDVYPGVDDFDVTCGEFLECTQPENFASSSQSNKTSSSSSEIVDQGPTIVYVPTRKQTVELANYLCKTGLRAAAYNAKMPKSHLRQVHEQFHCNALEVVVATIAFGMGIDKSNVRRIIHYGFPQSLEAYYQEAGRAGRDGKLADCTLYCNLMRAPTLLPNKRSGEQTKAAYRMLRDCFHYALNTSVCRARILVKYFGEEFGPDRCHMCDICINGPPQMHDFKEEAVVFMNVLQAQSGQPAEDMGCSSIPRCISGRRRFGEVPNFRVVVSYIREKFPRFATTDRIWWEGLARILEAKGYIHDAAETPRVLIQCPELTEAGLNFLSSQSEEEGLYAYPDAAILLAMNDPKPISTSSEWGRGWADPEIRRQRLAGKKMGRRKRKRHSRNQSTGFTTAKQRLAEILSKRRR